MSTDYEFSLSLPSADYESIATPVGVEYTGNINIAAVDSGIQFTTSSTLDQIFDFGLPESEKCLPHEITSQWPLLSPPPPTVLPSIANHQNSNMHTEIVSRGKQMANDPRPRQSSVQKVNRVRKIRTGERPHHAVEKRYRSTLNEKYAALAQTLSTEAVRRICSIESRDWEVPTDRNTSGSKDEQGGAIRQQKTATLSATIETITLLSRLCSLEANRVEELQRSVQEIRERVQYILKGKFPLES